MLFDTDRPEWQPLINPVSNLVYSATGDSVRDVFVAGEQVVAARPPDQDRREQALRGDPGGGRRASASTSSSTSMVQLRWPVS